MRQGLIVGTNGSSMRWYKDDVYHRDDGPAVIIDGDCWWYKNGKRHREDGPAIEFKDGKCFWMINDVFHRADGPAVEYPDGTKHWWYQSKEVNVSSQEEFEQWLKFKSFL